MEWSIDTTKVIARAVIIYVLSASLMGCAKRHNVHVASSDIPFSSQFRMQKGDAYEFQLPDGKTVAVWCEEPKLPELLAEQATKSGLKTAWGERPFRRPEPIRQQIGPNSYTLSGWKSYIVQGGVTTYGDETSEYELFVDDLRFSITEDLRATDSLPVTIKITRK
jgi:hypothetical protein